MKRLLSALLGTALLLAGCGGDDGDGGSSAGKPASGNDPDLVVCIGDSLTAGINCEGAPYPSRLAGMCGKTVLNLGVGGVSSAYGRSHVGEATSRRPGYVCILYGTNDPGHYIDPPETAANVRAIVSACKAAGCVPIVATPPPTIEPHWNNNSGLSEIAAALRDVARQEGAALVDLHAAFSGDPARYLNPEDGLHFSDAGGDLVARKFDSKL